MQGLAIFLSVLGLAGLYGRAKFGSNPTFETLRRRGHANWQWQLFGMLAPYTVPLAVALWVIIFIRNGSQQ